MDGAKEMTHSTHQMQLTSLYCYWPSFNEKQFNQKFRQQTQRQIIQLLQKNKNMTDREMANALGYKDPNKVRPRRNELVQGKKDKEGNTVIPSIIIEDEKRICQIGGKLSIAWKLNEETLNAYVNQ